MILGGLSSLLQKFYPQVDWKSSAKRNFNKKSQLELLNILQDIVPQGTEVKYRKSQ